MSLQQLTSGHKGAEGGRSVVIMLALNLIMLALFILLNAFAKPSVDKTDTARQSLAEGFDYRSSGQGRGSDNTTMRSPPWHVAIQQDIAGLAYNSLAVETIDFEADAKSLKLRLPIESLFDEGLVALKDGRQGFIENAAQHVAKLGPQAQLMVKVLGPEEGGLLAMQRMRGMVGLMHPFAPQQAVGAVAFGENVLELTFVIGDASAPATGLKDGLQPLGGAWEGRAR